MDAGCGWQGEGEGEGREWLWCPGWIGGREGERGVRQEEYDGEGNGGGEEDECAGGECGAE